MFEEIIAGVEMDLSILRYATFEELRVYCYRVASAVGLVSIEIFGYRNPALQTICDRAWVGLTNDQHHSRCREGFAGWPHLSAAGRSGAVHYSETELAKTGNITNVFSSLMQFEAARAREFFTRAAAALPPEDRRAMAPAEIMASIYRVCFDKWSWTSFVFSKKNID